MNKLLAIVLAASAVVLPLTSEARGPEVQIQFHAPSLPLLLPIPVGYAHVNSESFHAPVGYVGHYGYPVQYRHPGHYGHYYGHPGHYRHPGHYWHQRHPGHHGGHGYQHGGYRNDGDRGQHRGGHHR
ncbi:MAG: hypothetical protein ACKVQU_36715 [Burkholderiales bacterium]